MAPPNGVPQTIENGVYMPTTTTVPVEPIETEDNTATSQTNVCVNCKQNQREGTESEGLLKDLPNNNVHIVKTMNGDAKMEAAKDSDEEEADDEADIIVPPDGGWGWVIAFASFMCNLVVDGIIFSFGMFLPYIADDFGESKAKVALVGSLLSGFYLLVGPFVSALANRYGFRSVAIMGSFLSAAAFVLSYWATSIEFLFISYGFLGGVGFGLIYVPAVIAVGFYFEKWRALATGIAVCGSGIGTFVLAPIFSTLIVSIGWRQTLFVQAAMIITCSLFGILFRPLKPTKVSVKDIENAEPENKIPLMERIQMEKEANIKRADSTYGVNADYPTVAEVLSKSTLSLHKSTISLNKRHSVHPISEEDKPEEVVPQVLSAAATRRNSLKQQRQRSPSESEAPGVRSRRGTLTSGETARPMYRDDIFFGGSLARLPQYTSRTSMAWTMSVTHIPTQNDIEEEKKSSCKLCPEAVRRTLATMLDMSLLRSPSFVLLALSGGFTMMGFYVPFMYLTDRAILNEMDKSTAMWLVSAIGVCNTIGRVVCGLMSSFPKVNTLWVNNIAITLGGLVTIMSGLSNSAEYQFLYSCLFGLSISCFASLRSILLVDLMGLEKLTNAFGLCLLFQGVAAAIGAPMAGAFMDATGSYDASFYLSGSLILISGIMCYPLNMINQWEKRKQKGSVPV